MVIMSLGKIAFIFWHTDHTTRRHHHIETDFREAAMMSAPVSQLGCCKRLLHHCFIYFPRGWREQVEELVVALKVLTFAQASLMAWEMLELLNPRIFRHLFRAHVVCLMKSASDKEERCAKTESTDSDSYSTY
jgi:hypothetical protein